ncbi:pilus assembly FimT family protein [Blautia obeum]|uniref:pilus assembly FimT family protein n=1 Tax=Blautia obeum TaxID=40520 RepID=UPI000E4894FC|nr:prepilin-type N-terminal cleavage/methylation domain-containing protein [Blautia obeum]RGS17774.1 prepilin-type N-terminal cleavage/methylation domain-containing protein [Blautia obeum]
MKSKNRGFTLIELIVVIAVMTILLGIAIPSLNSILGFRVNRAANSIASALDKTRTEAMNRLVGEMKLEKRADGYYISYYLDRGKAGRKSDVQQDQPEKIAPARTQISYSVNGGNESVLQEGQSIIITYDRATGAFLPLQDNTWSQNDILSTLTAGNDIPLKREGNYCTQITVRSGSRYKTLQLIQETGKYTMTSGWN